MVKLQILTRLTYKFNVIQAKISTNYYGALIYSKTHLKEKIGINSLEASFEK